MSWLPARYLLTYLGDYLSPLGKIPPSKKEVPQEWVTLRPGLLTGWTLSTNQLESRTKSHTYSWGLLSWGPEAEGRRHYSNSGIKPEAEADLEANPWNMKLEPQKISCIKCVVSLRPRTTILYTISLGFMFHCFISCQIPSYLLTGLLVDTPRARDNP